MATTPDREIVYEEIRFCNKDLTKGTDLNYPAKETTTCRTSCFQIIETFAVSVFLHFSFSQCAKVRLRCFGTVREAQKQKRGNISPRGESLCMISSL